MFCSLSVFSRAYSQQKAIAPSIIQLPLPRFVADLLYNNTTNRNIVVWDLASRSASASASDNFFSYDGRLFHDDRPATEAVTEVIIAASVTDIYFMPVVEYSTLCRAAALRPRVYYVVII